MPFIRVAATDTGEIRTRALGAELEWMVVDALPGLISPLGIALWYGWNVAVLASIQLTVRLIRAFSVPTTLLGAAALTAGTLPIALVQFLLFGPDPRWYPLALAPTAIVGYLVARYVLRIRRLRGRIVAAFGTAAVAAAATDYIPADMESQVIAHTAMSNPGQTVEVTFTAPEQAGDYPFLCTFPGHFATMQGTMHVQG